MERITIAKDTAFQNIILTGLEASQYGLVKKSKSQSPSVLLYINEFTTTIALYVSALHNDELILVDYKKTAQIKILLDELRTKYSDTMGEIATLIESITDGSFYKENSSVTFL